MSLQILIAVADAVVATINDSELLDGDTEATRTLRQPDFDAAHQLNELVVVVYPVLAQKTLKARSLKEYRPQVDVAVLKRISNEADQDEAIEEIVLLADDISDLFLGTRITNEEEEVSAACPSVEHEWLLPGPLKSKNTVVSVMRLTFVANK